MSEYYTPSGSPGTSSPGASATMRAEFNAISAGFALLPTLAGNADLPIFINSGATALTSVTAVSARSKLGLGTMATQNANNVQITAGNIQTANATITGGSANNVAVTNAPTLTSANATITGGSFTNATELQTNNLQGTGGVLSGITMTGMIEVGTNNLQATGGSATSLSTLTSNNVTFTGGSANNVAITNAPTLTSANATITGGTVTAELKDYTETTASASISAGNLTLDFSQGNTFSVPLNANINTLTFANVTANKAVAATLILTADGTQRSGNWNNVLWPSGSAPILTSTNTKKDMLAFLTVDGGSHWLGAVCGQNY